MNVKRERWQIVIAGLIIGVIAALLVYFGNPSNMGFCIACFLRDTAGAAACTALPRCSTSVRRSSASCSARSS